MTFTLGDILASIHSILIFLPSLPSCGHYIFGLKVKKKFTPFEIFLVFPFGNGFFLQGP